jgi:hypothetical protein
MKILQVIDDKLKIANERKDFLLKEISLYKNNPDALIIHEQIELMRVNDTIELLNNLIEEVYGESN